MSGWALIIFMVLMIVTGLAVLLVGIVSACRRRWYWVLGSVATLMLVAVMLFGAGVWLTAKGARYAWRHTVVPARQAINEHYARWQAKVDARKALVDPAVLSAVPEEWFTYDGFRDWQRIPLVYPYEIHMIDVMDYCSLGSYRGGAVADPNHSVEQVQNPSRITHFSFDRRLLLGRMGPTRIEPDEPISWFIFDFGTRAVQHFATEQEMLDVARAQGYTGDTTLKTPETQWNDYFISP